MIHRKHHNSLTTLAVVTALTAVLAISGCATTSGEAAGADLADRRGGVETKAGGGAGNGVLAVEVERSGEPSTARFGMLTMIVESTDDPAYREHLLVNPSDEFVYIEGVPAGEYRIAEMSFRLAGSGLPEHIEVPGKTATVDSESLSLYPDAVVFGRTGAGEYVDLRALSNEERQKLEQRISSRLGIGGRRVSVH